MEVIDLPLGYKSAGVPTRLINAYYKKFKPKELDDVKILILEAHGPGALNTRKPVSKLEDLKGMKIRAHNISAKIVTALGGAPVGLPITDTYDALSKGVVEGVMLEKGGVYNWKLGEVVKYTVECAATGYSTSFYTVMNKDKWNSLPKDIQVIIDKLDEEWIDKAMNRWIVWDDMGKTELQKMGNTLTTLSKEESDRWSARTKPVIDTWVKEANAKGMAGDEILKFCLDWLKANQK
jgi:TRAP-type C4-dicarboxylate transport system substrate-binding protein